MLDVPLGSIRPAFQGIVPAPIATASATGVPNSTYVSIVWYVDEERIALSNQFLGKTAANMHENPYVALRVIDPTTMTEYEIDAVWLRSQTSGETFDTVRTQLEAVAAQSGMHDVFHLRAVEILRVDRCAPAANPAAAAPTTNTTDLLSSLDVFVTRLSECRDLAEATRVGLRAFDDLFSFRHSLLLVADPAGDHLFVVASNGYPVSGVGAEVALDDGVIGIAAHRRRQVRVSHLDRLTRAGGTGPDRTDSRYEIPLPGLPDVQSVLATPLLHHDRLIGVLYLDSAEPGRFDAAAGRLVGVLAGHLAVTVALLEAGGAEPLGAQQTLSPVRTTVSSATTIGR